MKRREIAARTEEQGHPVPELRLALESVGSVIESHRSARQKVRKLTETSISLIEPLLDRA